jgi:glutamyl-tRNA synthetase
MSNITRYAPSPTGRIHLGQVKAAFFPFAIARQSNGKFILRIEDTDNKRNKPEAVEFLLEDLSWLGIDYDLGPESAIEKNSFFQSQRFHIYSEFVQKLLDENKAYKAYETPEERAKQIKIQRSKGQSPAYFGEKPSSEQEKKYKSEGRKPVIRIKVPRDQIIKFKDAIYGEVVVNTNQIGDFVIQKSDGTPMYNFCVVIDDHMMNVNTVLRGFGHLSNTAKQILIYKIFGWEIPQFAHFSDIQNENTPGKLSKRHGAKSIAQYRLEGYLPQALINYIVNISCSIKYATRNDEIMKFDQCIEKVTLKNILKTNAKFNSQKLDWFNGQHIRILNDSEFMNQTIQWMESVLENIEFDLEINKKLIKTILADQQKLKRILPLIKPRINKLSEIPDYIAFFYDRPNTDSVDTKSTNHNFTEFEDIVQKIYTEVSTLNTPWTHEEWEGRIRALADQEGWKNADVFMALRLKIVGSKISPPLYESMEILGREECLYRLKN